MLSNHILGFGSTAMTPAMCETQVRSPSTAGISWLKSPTEPVMMVSIVLGLPAMAGSQHRYLFQVQAFPLWGYERVQEELQESASERVHITFTFVGMIVLFAASMRARSSSSRISSSRSLLEESG